MVVAGSHISFQVQHADQTVILQRFRNLLGSPCNCLTIVFLRLEHALLEMTGQQEQKRQSNQ